MLEALLKILSWNLPAPEILLEEDGDICLDWPNGTSISIAPSGKVSWADLASKMHGTDIEKVRVILEKRYS